jgi:RNA polymerase sigma-70 factor (ECF subfamily)
MDVAGSAHDQVRMRFEAVAVPLLAVVYRAALRFTRHADDARDVTQETFLRAFRTFDRFQPGTNCKAWLLTIAYSVFVNRYRRQQREPVIAVDDVDLLHEGSHAASLAPSSESTTSPFGSAIKGSGISDPVIEEALNQLPEAFRSAVILVDVEELTYEEAADVLACPVNTLRSRLFRGRRLLWTGLREYAGRQGYPTKGTARGQS